VVNNAGYVAFGALEENTYVSSLLATRSLIYRVDSPQETVDQFDTNVFGGLNVARAFLPYMRPRATGTIVWIGSLAGYR
jgi:NAD(P)-dependent dehydrogenase (short-subunit alcohol dehydrogenase family)